MYIDRLSDNFYKAFVKKQLDLRVNSVVRSGEQVLAYVVVSDNSRKVTEIITFENYDCNFYHLGKPISLKRQWLQKLAKTFLKYKKSYFKYIKDKAEEIFQ